MKTLKTLTFLVLTGTLASPAFAGHRLADSDIDYARVTNVSPIIRYDRVPVTSTECHTVRSYRSRGSDSYTPMIAGGILGGIIGNQFGNRSGKDFMTIAGTVLGGSIGNDHAKRGHAHPVSERVCDEVVSYREEEVVDGYRVTYRYHGKEYFTTMDYDPGERIRVRASVVPID